MSVLIHKEQIRNFCIIAHIDAGKSTLADRFLELTGTVSPEKMKPQYLDRMSLERERGITIKLQPVTMNYTQNSTLYTLNLIDTPGHVDFTYEVSRSLATVEGAILLVDARQGIQAQALSNLYLAREQNLTIIPVINKIDLAHVDLEERKKELANLLEIDEQEIILASAKTAEGVEKILEAVVKKIPFPKGTGESLRALIFDSFFDEYRGVVVYVRIVDGRVEKGDELKFLATGRTCETLEVGIFKPELKPADSLLTGQIGYIVTGLKDIDACRVGDTVTLANIREYDHESDKYIKPLPGYKEVKPMLFAGLYLREGEGPEILKRALERFKLNDASLVFEPEYFPALGTGFRCGFLGLLHLDIVRLRLEREYNLEPIITCPSVAYQVKLKNGQSLTIRSAQDLPDPTEIDQVLEPWMKIDIITPAGYVNQIMQLVKQRFGRFVSSEYLGKQMILHCQMPLALLIVDFHDKIKSVSSGYANFGYDFLDCQRCDVVKLDILVAGEVVPGLATIVYKETAVRRGREIVEKLKETISRQLFEVKLQASLGGKIIASERISPLRKDVTAKLYGGDVTRKMKLLKKQKKGKKKMEALGKVRIPPQAYLAVLKR